MDRTMKAYEVSTRDWPEMKLIIAGHSPGHAKSWMHCDATSVGYELPYVNIRARRKTEFDDQAQEHSGADLPVLLGWQSGRERWGVLSRIQVASRLAAARSLSLTKG